MLTIPQLTRLPKGVKRAKIGPEKTIQCLFQEQGCPLRLKKRDYIDHLIKEHCEEIFRSVKKFDFLMEEKNRCEKRYKRLLRGVLWTDFFQKRMIEKLNNENRMLRLKLSQLEEGESKLGGFQAFLSTSTEPMAGLLNDAKSTKSTMIFYHVPEDKDDPDQPNGFMLNMPLEDIRVSHIRENFPMKGEYYFRFKYSTNNTTLWMDLTNDECRIPFYNNQIFVKATRISWLKEEEENNTKEETSYEGYKEFITEEKNQKGDSKNSNNGVAKKENNLLDF